MYTFKKQASGPTELEMCSSEPLDMYPGNRTQGLQKTSNYFYLGSHLSSLRNKSFYESIILYVNFNSLKLPQNYQIQIIKK